MSNRQDNILNDCRTKTSRIDAHLVVAWRQRQKQIIAVLSRLRFPGQSGLSIFHTYGGIANAGVSRVGDNSVQIGSVDLRQRHGCRGGQGQTPQQGP